VAYVITLGVCAYVYNLGGVSVLGALYWEPHIRPNCIGAQLQ
jgi:hypothetical protein